MPQAPNRRRSFVTSLVVFVILSLGIHHSTHAAIVYSGLQNIPIATNFDGTYLDVDTATTSTSAITGWDVNFFFGGYGIANSAAFQPVRASTSNMSAVLNLASGTLVDGGSVFSTGEAGSDSHMGTGIVQFAPGTDGYIGFKFTTNTSDGPYYGWMRVNLTYNTAGAVIKDWAYDDSGLGINAGSMLVVPEPQRASLALLGMIGLSFYRRRK